MCLFVVDISENGTHNDEKINFVCERNLIQKRDDGIFKVYSFANPYETQNILFWKVCRLRFEVYLNIVVILSSYLKH